MARIPDRKQGTSALLIPPFAEEMNKTRRMMTVVSQELAARGVATVLVDLYGTGDSAGEFSSADWEVWRSDLLAVTGWMEGIGWPVKSLIGVRLGCALGAQVASCLHGRVERSVFWQPVTDGSRYLTQFLRLRVAASMMVGVRESVSELRSILRDTSSIVEVAGYELSSRLAGQIDAMRLSDLLTPSLGRLHWMDVVREGENEPAAEQQVGGHVCRRLSIVGEPFWSSTEIVCNKQIVAESISALT